MQKVLRRYHNVCVHHVLRQQVVQPFQHWLYEEEGGEWRRHSTEPGFKGFIHDGSDDQTQTGPDDQTQTDPDDQTQT